MGSPYKSLFLDLCHCGCGEVVYGGRQYLKGHYAKLYPPFKGRHWDKENKDRISRQHSGKIISEEVKYLWSLHRRGMPKPKSFIEKVCGDKNYNWTGGKIKAIERRLEKVNERGCIVVSETNPYSESVEYHHPDPNMPFVVPCPKRIHRMFRGTSHYNNVNVFLGILNIEYPEVFLFKHTDIEQDVL